MNLKLILSTAVAVVLFAGAASAVTITNRDASAHKLTVLEGETSKDVTIQPNQTITELCKESCGIRINDDEGNEYEVEVNEVVSIEQGQMTFEGDTQDQGSASSDQTTGSTKED